MKWWKYQSVLPRITEPRPSTEWLRKRIERPTRETLWGQHHWVRPRLVTEIFGDGEILLWLRPLATRPEFYVVRIDSSWMGDEIYDHLDAIYDSICLEYGDNSDEGEDGDGLPWPALDLSCGTEWGEMAWPEDRKQLALFEYV